jgi:hypothetical protein
VVIRAIICVATGTIAYWTGKKRNRAKAMGGSSIAGGILALEASFLG